MNRKPMSIEQLFIVDKKIIKRACKIQSEMQEKFDVELLDNNYVGLHGLFHHHLLIETELYYNGELLATYSMFKALREYKYDYRLTAFHFESLLTRIVSLWEYIYQFINHYLDLNLYDFKSKDEIIERSQYDPEFISKGNGKTIKWIKKTENECKKIKKQLKDNIKNINMKNIINYSYGKYEIKDNWEELMKVIANNNIKYVKEIRNQLIHQRPAGAMYTVSFNSLLGGYNVSINKSGWINFDEVESQIDTCMGKIKHAIQTIKSIVYNDEYPNRIENAGKEFYLEEVKCRACSKQFLVPAELLGENYIYLDIIACYECKQMGVDRINNRIKTNEINFGTLYGQYLRKIEEDC